MKDFKIYLKERLNEYDIHLRNRVHECDIIVEALVMRDGLTITDYVLLESCLDSYLLTKFAAIQLGSDIVAHIDRMAKKCYEKINASVCPDAAVELYARLRSEAEESAISFAMDPVALRARTFAKGESSVELMAFDALSTIKKFTSPLSSEADIAAEIFKLTKRSHISVVNAISTEAIVSGTLAKAHATGDSSIAFDVSQTELYRRLYDEITFGLENELSVRDMEYSNGLGIFDAETIIEESLDFASERLTKMLYIECAGVIDACLTESVRCFLELNSPSVDIDALASFRLLRARHLSEFDDGLLSVEESSHLSEMDYIILAE